METTATFFLPAIQGEPTGGNLFNRRVIEGLRARMSVHVRVHRTDALSPPPRKDPTPSVGIVDSLLLHEHRSFGRWARSLDVDRLVLLVHYLDLVDTDYGSKPRAARERELLGLFDAFVGPSRFVRRRLSDELGSASAVHLVRPGIADTFKRPSHRRSSAADTPEILTVSSLLPQKELTAGLEALEQLSAERWRWRIVGSETLNPDYAERLRWSIDDADMTGRIDVVGVVDEEDMAAVYDEADLFFLPSRFETCSMVTMEAMTRGLPVVACDAGGLPELVTDGVTGYLAGPGAVHTMAGYLRALLNDHERRRRMGWAARDRSTSFPSWDESAAQLHDILSPDFSQSS